MKAMILAAGIGSRLRPLTESTPKALLEVGGVPMLEIVLRRLIKAGVNEAIVNVFHLGEKVAGFLKDKANFGIRIELSREDVLLDTGGGLKKAAWFFDDGRPFFLHNVDVLTDLDLARLAKAHAASGALATLAVRSRPSSRSLLFDREGRLCGWESAAEGRREWAGPMVRNAERLAFDGVHVISPELLGRLKETGVFSINSAYLRLAGEGAAVRAFRADDYYWHDIGSAQKLEEARKRFRREDLPI